MNLVSNLGYKPSEKSKVRRRNLKKQITRKSFEVVAEFLIRLKEEENGYRENRIESDLNWLARELDKGRFQSKSLDSADIFQKMGKEMRGRYS